MAQFLRSSGAMDLSLAASAGEMWEADRSVQVGDVLTLAVDCPHVTDSSAYYTQTVREVTVGAIIRYFPEQGVWPFAGDPQSHVVIGSSKLLYSLYSDGFKTMTYEEKVGLQMRKDWLYAYNYGEAGFSLYAGEGATTENTLILAVCRRGHTDAVMATAKAHGARGGTVIKGRLSGSEDLEQAYGLDLTPEREVVAIVVPRDKRGPIMDAVNAAHGLRQEAQTILCALPIDHIVRLG